MAFSFWAQKDKIIDVYSEDNDVRCDPCFKKSLEGTESSMVWTVLTLCIYGCRIQYKVVYA